MHAARAFTAALVLAALAAEVGGATAAGVQRPSYRAALESYRGGDTAAAFNAIVQFRPIDIDHEFGDLIKAENTRVKKEGGPRTWLQVAAVMQLEYSQTRGDTIFSLNGRTIARDQAWTPVLALYDPPRGRRAEGPGTDAEFLRAWFRYEVVRETGRGRWPFASRVLQEADAQIGEDAELLLAKGALHELAWRTEHDEERPLEFHGDLAAAETALGRAIEIDPKLDEARLRLGRVQGKRAEADAALATLAALRSPATEAGFVYLARLFEGEVLESTREFEKAEAAYRAAIAAMPSAESAQIALANLLHGAGRRDEALRRILDLSAGANTRAKNDPWILYRTGEAWRQDDYFDALRALVVRP